MELESTDSIQGMYMLVSGPMDRAMDVVYIPLRMVVDLLENLNGVLSMALVTTISGEKSVSFLLNVVQCLCSSH